MNRPVLLVLAGVSGAGKSAIGGNIVSRRAGKPWFDPDRCTRLLVQGGMLPGQASAPALQHGADLVDRAMVQVRGGADFLRASAVQVTERVPSRHGDARAGRAPQCCS